MGAADDSLRLPPGLEEYDVDISLDHFAAHVAEMCSPSAPQSAGHSVPLVAGSRLGAAPPTFTSAGSCSSSCSVAEPMPRDAHPPGATAQLRFFVPHSVGSPVSVPIVCVETERIPTLQEEHIHRLPRQLLAVQSEPGGAPAHRQIPVRGAGRGGSYGSVGGGGSSHGDGVSGDARDWNSGGGGDGGAPPAGAPFAALHDVRCDAWRPLPSAAAAPSHGGHAEAHGTFQLFFDDPAYGAGGGASSCSPSTSGFGVQHSCWMPAASSPLTQLPFSFGTAGASATVEHYLPVHFDLGPATAAPASFSAAARRRQRRETAERRCATCGTTESPKWRNAGTLCNACGLAARKREVTSQRRAAAAAQEVVAHASAPASGRRQAAAAQPMCATPVEGQMQLPIPIAIAHPIGEGQLMTQHTQHQLPHDAPTGQPYAQARSGTACAGAPYVCAGDMVPQAPHAAAPLPHVSSAGAAPAFQLATGWAGASLGCDANTAQGGGGSGTAATDEPRQGEGGNGEQHEPGSPPGHP
jgi:hypothetical protein